MKGMESDKAQTFSFIYGMKMLPASDVDAVEDAPLRLTDGTSSHITMHLIEGSKEQIKALMLQSIDAYFELYGEL